MFAAAGGIPRPGVKAVVDLLDVVRELTLEAGAFGPWLQTALAATAAADDTARQNLFAALTTPDGHGVSFASRRDALLHFWDYCTQRGQRAKRA
jgi:hypothetical protein